jgi:hypothetical protein
MPYIARDYAGHINVLFYQPVAEITEFLPTSHPEVLAFLAESNRGLRDFDNAIFRHPAPQARGFLPTNSLGALGFYADDKGACDLDRLVGEVIGAVEDVVGALLSKKSLLITDLSPAAQKFVRQDKLNGKPLGAILSDDGDVRLP